MILLLHPMYRHYRQAAPHTGVFVVRKHWRFWPLFYWLAVVSVSPEPGQTAP